MKSKFKGSGAAGDMRVFNTGGSPGASENDDNGPETVRWNAASGLTSPATCISGPEREIIPMSGEREQVVS